MDTYIYIYSYLDKGLGQILNLKVYMLKMGSLPSAILRLILLLLLVFSVVW